MELSPQPPEPSSPEAPASEAASPMEVGLRLIAERLDVPTALLFAADAAGALRVVASVGTTSGDALVLRGLAETLGGPDVLDVPGAIEGARFVAGARLGDGALLVLSPDDRQPDDAWNEAFAAAVRLANGLIQTERGGGDSARLLHEIAVHPGTFDVRLDLALQRAAEALGLDAAVFARIDDDEWTPEAVFDPSGHLVPTVPVPLEETFCALTCRTDGPFGIEDAAASALDVETPVSYLGAPVFVGGKCAGTFSVVGHAPRARPFTEDDRALVESLARWIGSALAGRDTARRLAEREAALAAFFDGAPMGMGVTRLVQRPDGADDLELVTINEAAAATFGASPEALVGRLASDVGLGGPILSLWTAACRQAATGSARRFEVEAGQPDARVLAITIARIDIEEPGDDGRFTFVMEDVTALRRAAEHVRERDAQLEAIVSQAPVALFATDAEGRITMSRGRGADALGLDGAQGAALPDLFASIPEAEVSVLRALEGVAASWTVMADDRWFECRTLPTCDDGEVFTGLIGVALDVTDRERGAQALAQASRSLETAARARMAFLRHLNHEIRSPLTSILGYADLLSAESPPEEIVQGRDVIVRSGGRLLAALDDLLDLTLLDSDDVTVTPTPTYVGEIVEAEAEANRTAADARRLSLNLWCTLPEEPLLLDANLFERIARHLIGGAVASATGSRVDVRLSAAGPGRIELRVAGGSDAALGIGPDLVHRLVAAMGGTSDQVGGDAPGWVVRLPRQRVPVVDFGPEAEAVPDPLSDAPIAGRAARGEAPPVARIPVAG